MGLLTWAILFFVVTVAAGILGFTNLFQPVAGAAQALCLVAAVFFLAVAAIALHLKLSP